MCVCFSVCKMYDIKEEMGLFRGIKRTSWWGKETEGEHRRTRESEGAEYKQSTKIHIYNVLRNSLFYVVTKKKNY